MSARTITEPGYIAAGWFTPDYESWFKRLEQSLIEHGEPYDFRPVPKLPGGWERNTCRKPGFILEAMRRHPGKVIIFLDVDCVVTGSLAPLAKLPCDVALYLHSSQKKRRLTAVALTGHMALQPTAKTRELVEAWAEISAEPPFGANDQDTFLLAINRVDGFSLMNVGASAGGLVLHDRASSAHRKVGGRQRLLHSLSGLNPFRKRAA